MEIAWKTKPFFFTHGEVEVLEDSGTVVQLKTVLLPKLLIQISLGVEQLVVSIVGEFFPRHQRIKVRGVSNEPCKKQKKRAKVGPINSKNFNS